MMTEPTRYYRYVATATLSRLLTPLQDTSILRLEAARSWQHKAKKAPPVLSYVSLKGRQIGHLEIDYNSLVDSPFNKKGVSDFLQSSGAQDASVDHLDVLVPPTVGLGDRYAEARKDPGLAHQEFVASFVKYPASRDKEGETEFTRFLQSWHDKPEPLESLLNLHLASLDFEYAIPVANWREISRTRRLSKQYQEMLDEWKEWHQGAAASVIRDIVRAIFPPSMTSGRQYTLKSKGQWVLSKHGDF
jgi:hypothetical protein